MHAGHGLSAALAAVSRQYVAGSRRISAFFWRPVVARNIARLEPFLLEKAAEAR
jgi:hypothetical protein